MKQFWLRLSTRIDALSLRERVMLFAAVLAAMVFLSYFMVLSPLFARQEQLSANMERQRATIAQVEAQISEVARNSAVDPDVASRARLDALQAEVRQLSNNLRGMQESLVEPERIAPLLEAMLRSNGRLKLIALRTLPVTGLSGALAANEEEATQAATPAPAAPAASLVPEQMAAQMIAQAAAKAGTVAAPAAVAPGASSAVAAPVPELKVPELIYRHGVELTLEGGYVDLVNYMAQLENMPVELIWGSARLDASRHPRTQLTLTLYTLSLEKDWMKL